MSAGKGTPEVRALRSALLRIGALIYAQGAPLGSPEYFEIRELTAPLLRGELPSHPSGQYYSLQSDGHLMLCNAAGTRSIFDDVDE